MPFPECAEVNAACGYPEGTRNGLGTRKDTPQFTTNGLCDSVNQRSEPSTCRPDAKRTYKPYVVYPIVYLTSSSPSGAVPSGAWKPARLLVLLIAVIPA